MEGKYEVEMRTPIDDFGILPRYQEARKLPLVLVRALHKESLARAKLPVG
jgi:hypothetical protein